MSQNEKPREADSQRGPHQTRNTDRPTVTPPGQTRQELREGEPFNPYRAFGRVFQIPEVIAKRSNLSHGAKLAYGRLLKFGGRDGLAHPALSTLAHEIGVKDRQVFKYVRELIAAGLITARKRRSSDGCRTSNQYAFLWKNYLHDTADGSTCTKVHSQPALATCTRNLHDTAEESASEVEVHREEEVHQSGSAATETSPVSRTAPLSAWPATAIAIRSRFPATHDELILEIAAAARKAFPDVTDAELTDAIHGDATRKKQKSADHYLRTVSMLIRSFRHVEAVKHHMRLLQERPASGKPAPIVRVISTTQASPKRPNGELEAIFPDIADAIWCRHRAGRKGTREIVQQAISDVISASVDPVAELRSIDRAHAAWCASNDWQEELGKYVKTLETWIYQRKYLNEPPPSKTDLQRIESDEVMRLARANMRRTAP